MPLKKSVITAWSLFDFANSSFAMIMVTFVYPLYYAGVIVTDGKGDLYWGIAMSSSMLLVALIAPALGAIAGLGAAMGVSNNREDANGYERTGTVNGQMQSESWNKSDSTGKFSVVVANRFMIEAEGKAASVDELKAAVAMVDQGNLMGLAS